MAEEMKRAPHWFNYRALADKYNQLKVGENLRMRRFSNITNFKQAMTRRGLEEGVDYEAFSRRQNSFVKRLSSIEMGE